MPNEIQQIISKILILPNRPPFMLDRDVAELYETETRIVNQAVSRNPERFPDDFRFQLTQEEAEKVIANCDNRVKPSDFDITDCDIKTDGRGGYRKLPMLPNGWQMYELRMIHGIEGARKILKDFFGIYPDRFKFGITPWEAQVIRKDNPCREHRNKQIVELIERGVSQEQIAIMSGFSRPQISSIYSVSKKLEAIEAGKYVE